MRGPRPKESLSSVPPINSMWKPRGSLAIRERGPMALRPRLTTSLPFFKSLTESVSSLLSEDSVPARGPALNAKPMLFMALKPYTPWPHRQIRFPENGRTVPPNLQCSNKIATKKLAA